MIVMTTTIVMSLLGIVGTTGAFFAIERALS